MAEGKLKQRGEDEKENLQDVACTEGGNRPPKSDRNQHPKQDSAPVPTDEPKDSAYHSFTVPSLTYERWVTASTVLCCSAQIA